MTPVQQTLAGIRWVSAIGYFVAALALFALALWLAGPVGNWWWPFDIVAGLIAWVGINLVRHGCEELSQNEAQRAAQRGRNDGG